MSTQCGVLVIKFTVHRVEKRERRIRTKRRIWQQYPILRTRSNRSSRFDSTATYCVPLPIVQGPNYYFLYTVLSHELTLCVCTLTLQGYYWLESIGSSIICTVSTTGMVNWTTNSNESITPIIFHSHCITGKEDGGGDGGVMEDEGTL